MTTIAGEYPDFIIPAGGEEWHAGSLHRIAWATAAPEKNVRLEFSLDNGQTWLLIWDAAGQSALKLQGSASLLWRVPDHAGSCRLRLKETGSDAAPKATVDVVIKASTAKNYRWRPVTLKAAFAPRDGAGALTFKGRMWLLGGWNPFDQAHFPNDCNSEVWSSVDGRDWRLENPAAPWEKRHTAGYAVHRDRMWVLGGDPIQNHYQPDVWSSPDGINWECATDRAPWGERVLHHTVVHAGKIWVMGGQRFTPKMSQHLPHWQGQVEPVYFNDVWSSADGIRWECVQANAPWSPRGMIGGSAVKDGRIWLLSGGTYYEQHFPEVWSSADGIRWQQHLEQTPFHPRYYHDVAVFDERLWILEGAAKPGGNRNDVWYSSDGSNWYEVPATPWSVRHAASVFVHAGALWIGGGNNPNNDMQADVWRLAPDGE